MTGVSSNGAVRRLARKGVIEVAFGDEGQPGSEPFKVDVCEVHNEWYQIDHSFRDAEGKLPDGQMVAYGQAKRTFVQSLASRALGEKAPILCQGEADGFINLLYVEVQAVRLFFDPVKNADKPPSLAGRTDIQFSQ